MAGKDKGEDQDWDATVALVQPLLVLAGAGYLDNIRSTMAEVGVAAAVLQKNTRAVFEWLLDIVQFQGVSDVAAASYSAVHGGASWADLASALSSRPACLKLSGYWHFHDCGYQKSSATCSRPDLLGLCPLPLHPFRNGRLSQSAYSLFLFIRDVCDSDLVSWIDLQLDRANAGTSDRAARMRNAVLGPMTNVFGVSDKVLSMVMAELLLGADPDRERWVTTGASMVAIDTLVHNFFHRTGVLHRHHAQHPYGPRCYAPGGCSDIICEVSLRIDASDFDQAYPTNFPRFVQRSIWQFCAQAHWDICNGNSVDDRFPCSNRFCPVFARCERLPLNPLLPIN